MAEKIPTSQRTLKNPRSEDGHGSESSNPSYVSVIQSKEVLWRTDTDFNKGTHSGTEVSGTGKSAVVRLNELVDNDDDIPYITAGDYTLSDAGKLEIAGGSAKLKAQTGAERDWPFTTPANYTYDASIIDVTSGAATLKNDFSNSYCALFDGVNEYLNIGSTAQLDFERTQPFSISAWIKFDASGSYQIIAQRGEASANSKRNYILFRGSNNKISFYMQSTNSNRLSVETSTTVATSVWLHIIVTYDGSSNATGVNIYVDSVDRTLTTTSNTLTANVSNTGNALWAAQYGTGSGALSAFLNGSLDEGSIWDTKLTSTQVTEIYNSGNPTKLTIHSSSANLVGWWRMGDGDTFPTFIDNSTNTNDATMTNMEALDIASSSLTGAPYAQNDPTIIGTTGFVYVASLLSFTEASTQPTDTGIKYHISIDGGTIWQYWNGSSWATTDDTYIQANTVTEINANLSSLPVSGTFKFRALLHSATGLATPTLDNVFISETQTFSTVDNLYIDTTNLSQIAPTTNYAWLTSIITNTLPASTDIKLLFSIDGRASWLTWSGSAWVVPVSATARANATSVADVEANFSSLALGSGTLDVRLFIYTSDNFVRPTIDNINATSDNGFETSGTYESNSYDSSYINEDWNKILYSIALGTGTAIFRVAISIDGITWEAWSAAYSSGEEIVESGRYIKWKVDLTGDGITSPELDNLSMFYITQATIAVSP